MKNSNSYSQTVKAFYIALFSHSILGKVRLQPTSFSPFNDFLTVRYQREEKGSSVAISKLLAQVGYDEKVILSVNRKNTLNHKFPPYHILTFSITFHIKKHYNSF